MTNTNMYCCLLCDSHKQTNSQKEMPTAWLGSLQPVAKSMVRTEDLRGPRGMSSGFCCRVTDDLLKIRARSAK